MPEQYPIITWTASWSLYAVMLVLCDADTGVLASPYRQGESQNDMSYVVQVATELVVGFDKSFATKELLVRHQKLWADWLDGFFALPINFPGFGMFQACDM